MAKIVHVWRYETDAPGADEAEMARIEEHMAAFTPGFLQASNILFNVDHAARSGAHGHKTTPFTTKATMVSLEHH